jgi:hypothetical protein
MLVKSVLGLLLVARGIRKGLKGRVGITVEFEDETSVGGGKKDTDELATVEIKPRHELKIV